jgi:peptide/nickel transport system ATP-binding protein
LKDLARQDGLSYMLISHDIAAVSYMADRIAVLNGGRMVEFGTAQEVLTSPRNAYTRELIAASPHFRTSQPGGALDTIDLVTPTAQPSAV